MRFLKKKIALSKALKDEKLQQNSSLIGTLVQNVPKPTLTTKHKRVYEDLATPKSSRTTKNIVKNYGKAICNFGVSRLALPYLSASIDREGVKLEGFVEFLNQAKIKIDGLYHFRSLLLESHHDSVEIASYKRIFKEMSEVFIKYFSVNWIFHSKIFHKEPHLRFRFKMLRRIRCPELFTYLTNSKDKKKLKSC